ncbi:MAG: transglutaminase-like domain-containing protein [Planctomycetota bacterium]|jgi:hypothetical protein
MTISKGIKTVLIIFLLHPPIPYSYGQGTGKEIIELSDAPSSQIDVKETDCTSKLSYYGALQNWKTVKDVNNWIGQNFEYDMDRAMQLADNSGTRGKTNIYKPDELFHHKKGVCIDLARFALETIQAIDPAIDIKYLLIEFEPLLMGNRVFKNHWMIMYKENDQLYIMADTKRPGHISGPYNAMSEFITAYEDFRKRKIISYKITDTYKKRLKKRLRKSLKK